RKGGAGGRAMRGEISWLGIEPRSGPSDDPMLFRYTTRMGFSAACGLAGRALSRKRQNRADGRGRTGMGLLTRQVPFQGRATSAARAGAQGFEPCAAVLETACSPRSTLLCQCVRGELNPPPRRSQRRMPSRYTTNTVNAVAGSGNDPDEPAL